MKKIVYEDQGVVLHKEGHNKYSFRGKKLSGPSISIRLHGGWMTVTPADAEVERVSIGFARP